MYPLIKNNILFLGGWLIIALFTFVFLLSYDQAASFALINQIHNNTLDLLFGFLTYLGDGFVIVPLAILIFFLGKRVFALLAISSYLLSGIFVQTIKTLFPHPRPRLYFELHHIPFPFSTNMEQLHTINSFPSGHTASVFAIITVAACMAKRKSTSLLLLTLAVLVGYSRIYLGQHFPEDVLAGSAIGVVSAVLCVTLLQSFFKRKTEKKNS